MRMIVVAIAAVVIATICLECVRNKDYEDGVLGRASLWLLILCAGARLTQIAGVAFQPWLGEEWASVDLKLDNVETVLWVGLLVFLARHYYRFRRALVDDSYAWRPSTKRPA